MKNTGMERKVFRNKKPPAILACLKRLYGTPRLQELNQSLLRLHDPMDCDQLVEVMLRTTEEVQTFLMAHPDGDSELRYFNLMIYTILKLLKCGGLYTKAIERWKIKNAVDNKIHFGL